MLMLYCYEVQSLLQDDYMYHVTFLSTLSIVSTKNVLSVTGLSPIEKCCC